MFSPHVGTAVLKGLSPGGEFVENRENNKREGEEEKGGGGKRERER